MKYFKDIPTFTYPVFKEFSDVSDFVGMMLALEEIRANKNTRDEDLFKKSGYSRHIINMFRNLYGPKAALLIDIVDASDFNLSSGLRVLYLEHWVEAKCYPEFAMLPRSIRCAVAKSLSVHDAVEKFEIKDFEEFDCAFLTWAKKAKCNMDHVDYQDFVAACYLASKTQ